MSPFSFFRLSLAELWSHKLRSSLTLAGIILGTSTLVVLTSLMDGITVEIERGFYDLGFDGVLYVVERRPRTAYETALFARSEGLRPEDALIARDRADVLANLAPVHQSRVMVKANGRAATVRILGVTPAYADVRNRHPAEGRFISDSDIRSFNKTVVIGHRLKRRLFGTAPALGQRLDVGGISMTVVGVGRDMTHQFFDDHELIQEMEGCAVPLTTLERYVTGRMPLSYIAVKSRDPEEIEGARREIERVFSLAHNGLRDFRVENIAEEILRARSEVDQIIVNWRMVLSAIAGISLLVGGIGLLSVMLISIGERTYEIGLRKAVGAAEGEVFLQFLVESICLALAGAAVGIALGCAANLAAGSFFKSGLPVNFSGILLALGVDLLLGVSFGTYPALRASRLQPIEALRAA
jgi:putative ABC transport system permease protein